MTQESALCAAEGIEFESELEPEPNPSGARSEQDERVNARVHSSITRATTLSPLLTVFIFYPFSTFGFSVSSAKGINTTVLPYLMGIPKLLYTVPLAPISLYEKKGFERLAGYSMTTS